MTSSTVNIILRQLYKQSEIESLIKIPYGQEKMYIQQIKDLEIT